MSISSVSGSSFYSKFMQLMSQDRNDQKTSFEDAAKQAEEATSAELSLPSQTTKNTVSTSARTDTIQISAEGRAYMQIRMSCNSSANETEQTIENTTVTEADIEASLNTGTIAFFANNIKINKI